MKTTYETGSDGGLGCLLILPAFFIILAGVALYVYRLYFWLRHGEALEQYRYVCQIIPAEWLKRFAEWDTWLGIKEILLWIVAQDLALSAIICGFLLFILCAVISGTTESWSTPYAQAPPHSIKEKVPPKPQAVDIDPPHSEEEIKLKKETEFKQCPTCGKWDVLRAYTFGGAMDDWCPHCKKWIPKLTAKKTSSIWRWSTQPIENLKDASQVLNDVHCKKWIPKLTAKKTSSVWRWLTQPIENRNDAFQVLNDVSKGLYIIASIYLIIGIFLFFTRNLPAIIFNILICLSAGYYLPTRKSRSLAIILFVYSFLFTIDAFVSFIWLYKPGLGGKSIFLAVIVLLMSYRSIIATNMYQRALNVKISWKNVSITLLISLIILIITFCFYVLLMNSYGFNLNLNKTYIYLPSFCMFIIVPTLGLLTFWLPFARTNK
jgi:hypothetical protein